MSKESLTDEQKELYEKEYLEFLTEKIKGSGGSIQFQHIICLLSQLDVCVKKAVGCDKLKVMKFLKAHPNSFKVDTKGIVTVIESQTVKNDNFNDSEVITDDSKLSVPSTIENGKGRIASIFAEFGFIDATHPFKTSVYFSASQFSDDKNTLLTDFNLQVGTNVLFNAVKGFNDCEAKYRATKVWKTCGSGYEDEGNQDYNATKNNNFNNTSHLDGIGIIEKLCPEFAIITVEGDSKNSLYFNKTHIDYDNIEDLTKIFSKGEKVYFIANKITRQDSKSQWQTAQVWKKSPKRRSPKNSENYSVSDSEDRCYNDCSLPSASNLVDHYRTSFKPKHSLKDAKFKKHSKEMKKDQCGKIYPHSKGIDIMFGENFSELANGNSAVYFLYGSRVTEVNWEYSKGDDVYFDAVKVKSGWEAVLVWVGDRPDFVLPTCLGDFSSFTDDEVKSEEFAYSSKSDTYFPEADILPVKSELNSQQLATKSKKFAKKNSFELNDLTSNRSTKTGKEFARANLQSPQKKPENAISKTAEFSKKSKKHSRKENYLEMNVRGARSDMLTNNDKFYDENHDILASDISDASRDKEIVSDCNRSYENLNPKKPGIKKFQDIDGKIFKVYCKYAIVKNSELQKPLSLFLHTFYCDGLSAEERYYDDLREIIEVGEIVKLNCYEIIEDSGELHQIVTMAWKGIKPKIDEMTPEDFIKKHQWCVTLNDDSHTDYIKEQNNFPKKFLSVMGEDYDSNTHESISRDLSEDEADSMKCQDSPTALSAIVSDIIYEKLKRNSVCFPDSEVNLNALSTEVISVVLKYSNAKETDSCSWKQTVQDDDKKEISDLVCSVCESYRLSSMKTISRSHKEVQTIITGEIIAQRGGFSFP